MTLKEKIINEIIEIEGGYVNDPNDSGGATKYGITEKVAKANGYNGEMKDLPKELAFNIYSAKYWDSIKGDQVVKLSQEVAIEMADTAVNMGVYRAVYFLQRALNVLNDRERLYKDIATDGAIGNKTIKALQSYLNNRPSSGLLKALNCLQGSFYINLAERRQKDEKYVYGWLKNRVKL